MPPPNATSAELDRRLRMFVYQHLLRHEKCPTVAEMARRLRTTAARVRASLTRLSENHAFMARYIAKNIVAAGLADKCEVQLAYAIGVAEPVSVLVETFGTEKVDPAIIPDLVRANFQLTPKGIIDSLNLRRPIYRKTAAYGHFGRTDKDFTWEATDKAAKLASEAGLREPALQTAKR